MSPEDVLQELRTEYGIPMCRRTLLNYEKEGLIPQAKRGSGGRGVGAYADYPLDTPGKLAFAYITKKGASLDSTSLDKRIARLEVELQALRCIRQTSIGGV